jgi:hypothetical protein
MNTDRFTCICLGFALAVLFTTAPQPQDNTTNSRPQASLPALPATGAHTGP